MNEKSTNNINNSTKAKGGTLDEKLQPTANGETEVFIQTKPSRAKTACSRVDDVSLLSFISFSWMFPWMWRAFRGQLSPVESSAQWTCSIFDSANVNMTRLEHLWNEEIKSAAAFARPPSLFRAVFRFIRFRLMMTCLVFLFCIVFGFIGPTCLVRGLIAFTERPIRDETDGTPLYSYGFYLAFSILMVEMLRVLAYGATWAISYRTAIRARGALLALLFKRLMHAKSLRRKTPAEIVNLFANDGQRIFDALTFAPLVLVGPFVLIGGLVYLLFVIGVLSLLGIAVFFVFDIIQAVLGVTMVKFRNRAIAQTERRMALVGELIRCIKCIKLNGWEELFYNRVRAVRRAEQRSLGWAGYAQSLAVASGAIVPVVATIVMTLAIVLNGHDLRASDAFSAITVFFVMLFGIRMIPYGIRYLAEAKQALTKIEALLLFDPYDAEPQTAALSPAAATDIVIQMKQCTFAWDEAETEHDTTNEQKNGGEKRAAKKGSVVAQQQNGTIVAMASVPPRSTENGMDYDGGEGEMEVIIDTENGATKTATTDEQKPRFCIQDVSFNVHKGELVGICGVVGSGKSALLNALTGHLVGHDGRLSMSGTVALCGQQPCVLNTSVRENILFGQPMHFKRYYQAISAAQLTKDLEQLPENEQSKVSACKLSGGQRARIAIARSLFSNRDIYLFDDIFASVDKAVASKIFSAGIKEMLGNRTRLLVTGDPEYLSSCDRVLFMHRGRVIAQGTHAELVTNSAQYRTLFSSYSNASTIRSVNGDTVQLQQHSVAPSIVADQMANSIGAEEKAPIMTTNKKPSVVNSEDSVGTAEQNGEEEEHYGTKAIGKEIYMEYIRAGGGPLLCSLVIAAFILNVGANIFGTVWLKNWMRAAHSNHSATDGTGGSLADSPSFYINIYAFTLLVLFISGLLKALVFVKFTLTAATRLHNRMLRRVLYATAAFFHRTPSGRILNRFSKDMDEIDVKLPFSAEALLQGMFTCLGFIFMIIWTFPLFLVPCAPLFGLFLLFFLCFRAGIRCLKRVENVTRSPVFEHLTTSLDALPTIHAFGQTQRFVEQLKQHLDENSGALFLYHSAMRWQAVWLDLLVVGLTFFVSLFIVLLTGRIDPAEAGMAIAFAMQMSGIFQFAVRSQTELEAKLTSVERVSFYYKNIEVESDKDGDDPAELGPAWPQSGTLEFDHVILRYAPQMNPALSDVSFTVYSAQKVGIVGRTGSGKTSLCNALFRLYPIESGTIRLDGWDIERVGLRRLRRSMAIISQEPTLFAGTLRFNVDPEGGADDARILELFNRFGADNGLGNSIGLDFAVESGGRNLSAGQRQLVCMCRAMLRNVQIVVLDEATANVDIQTDERIQQSVRKEFADRTVLVITHRLTNVVTGLGRVLSMADGKLSDDNSATNNHRPTSTTSTELPKIVVDEAPPPPSSPSVDE